MKLVNRIIATIMLLGFLFNASFADINISQEKYKDQLSATAVINGTISVTFSKDKEIDQTKSFSGYGTCENIYSDNKGTYVLTAYHCIEYDSLLPLVIEWGKIYMPGWKYKSYKVELKVQYTSPGKSYDIKILCGDKDKDVVLLYIEGLTNQKYFEVRSPKLEIGADVYGIMVMGIDPIVKHANFAKILYYEEVNLGEGWTEQLLISGMWQPGNSGSGMMDKDGYLIAICHGANQKGFGASVGIATSGKTIINFLKLKNVPIPYLYK